jgi:hypothetical protein
LVAASFPHFFNGAQSRELLPRDPLDRKASPARFPSQPRHRHAASRETVFHRLVEAQGRIGADFWFVMPH